MATRVDYMISGVHLKSVGTKALMSGDAGTEIKFWVRNLTPEVLNFLNAIVGTDKNASHELDIAIIAYEEQVMGNG